MNQEEREKLIARLRTYAKVDSMSSETAAQRHICWIAADELEELVNFLAGLDGDCQTCRQLNEELAIWRSCFPDLIPENLKPMKENSNE